MKRLLLLMVVFILPASLVFAQAGNVGLFADVNGTVCAVPDTVSGLMSVYAVHVNTPGATACQFSAVQPGCFPATYLSDTAVWPVTIGDSQAGVAIGYGLCLASPIHVLTINFFATGLTATCCLYETAEDPNIPSGEIEVVDCNDQLLIGGSGAAIISNATITCDCDVATEETTWGRIKSIYSK